MLTFSFTYSQAYMRPKSTAVQITRIAAVTLVTMSVILGSFILAASWVQARASCTPESIAAMQAELRLQQQQQQPSSITYQQGEFLKHLQPEALIQVGDYNEIKILREFNFLGKYRPPFIRIIVVYLYFEGVILRDILQLLYIQLFHI